MPELVKQETRALRQNVLLIYLNRQLSSLRRLQTPDIEPKHSGIEQALAAHGLVGSFATGQQMLLRTGVSCRWEWPTQRPHDLQRQADFVQLVLQDFARAEDFT